MNKMIKVIFNYDVPKKFKKHEFTQICLKEKIPQYYLF